jgi:hypothetical protein
MSSAELRMLCHAGGQDDSCTRAEYVLAMMIKLVGLCLSVALSRCLSCLCLSSGCVCVSLSVSLCVCLSLSRCASLSLYLSSAAARYHELPVSAFRCIRLRPDRRPRAASRRARSTSTTSTARRNTSTSSTRTTTVGFVTCVTYVWRFRFVTNEKRKTSHL